MIISETDTSTPTPVAPAPRRRTTLHSRDWRLGWLLLLPLLVITVGLIGYPFVVGIAMAFQDRVIGSPGSWVGLKNFAALLTGPQYGPLFRKAVWVSLLYTGVAVIVKFVLGLIMSVLLNERFRGQTAMRGLLFIPWAVPVVVVGLTWRRMLEGSDQGLINAVLGQLFGMSPIGFLNDPHIALWSVVGVAVWQGTPFYTMMFLAGMQAVPAERYEAAAIDGADALRRFLHITLPALRPAIVITTLLSTIWTANSLNFVYLLTAGGPLNATTTFPMLAYQIGLQGNQLGLSAAVSVLFFPLFIVVIYFLTRRMLRSEGAE